MQPCVPPTKNAENKKQVGNKNILAKYKKYKETNKKRAFSWGQLIGCCDIKCRQQFVLHVDCRAHKTDSEIGAKPSRDKKREWGRRKGKDFDPKKRDRLSIIRLLPKVKLNETRQESRVEQLNQNSKKCLHSSNHSARFSNVFDEVCGHDNCFGFALICLQIFFYSKVLAST